MSTKKAIKSIKSQIEEKNHEAALYEATALLKSLKKEEPEVPQV
jgi:superkiller protein 3